MPADSTRNPDVERTISSDREPSQAPPEAVPSLDAYLAYLGLDEDAEEESEQEHMQQGQQPRLVAQAGAGQVEDARGAPPPTAPPLGQQQQQQQQKLLGTSSPGGESECDAGIAEAMQPVRAAEVIRPSGGHLDDKDDEEEEATKSSRLLLPPAPAVVVARGGDEAPTQAGPTNAMVTCTSCGAPIAADAKFCHICGSQQAAAQASPPQYLAAEKPPADVAGSLKGTQGAARSRRARGGVFSSLASGGGDRS